MDEELFEALETRFLPEHDDFFDLNVYDFGTHLEWELRLRFLPVKKGTCSRNVYQRVMLFVFQNTTCPILRISPAGYEWRFFFPNRPVLVVRCTRDVLSLLNFVLPSNYVVMPSNNRDTDVVRIDSDAPFYISNGSIFAFGIALAHVVDCQPAIGVCAHLNQKRDEFLWRKKGGGAVLRGMLCPTLSDDVLRRVVDFVFVD